MFVRFTRYSNLPPERITATVQEIASKLLPAMEDQVGCVDGFVLVDHQHGGVTGVTLWENEAAMRASERAAARVRADMDAGAIDWRTEPRIERHEIVLDRRQLLERGAAAAKAQSLG